MTTSITLRVNDIQFESADFESVSLCPVVGKHSPLWLQTVHWTVCLTRRAGRGQALLALATNNSQDCLLYASRHFDTLPCFVAPLRFLPYSVTFYAIPAVDRCILQQIAGFCNQNWVLLLSSLICIIVLSIKGIIL